jgi:exodeoxyribonuclease VII large subunit
MSEWDVPAFEPRCYTISELNREVRTLLESGFPLLWLQGEISNLARPASGHMYFSLKDAEAQVRCALFRFRSRAVNLQIRNGLQVRVQARISLYEPRGEFQLQIEQLELAGAGALRQAFDKLKHQLAAEGLFAVERKRPLPRYARRIGLITSTSGAAIRDVLSVLRRRFPALPVRVYPTAVQGDEAVAGIVRALQQVGEQGACDVVLLVRGGGSLEDLHAFNHEAVARAMIACPIPVVTGVGHETDVSIADFAADVRAATPSAAAELVSPDRAAWQTRLVHIDQRLQAVLQRRLREQRQQVEHWRLRLDQRHPQRQLHQHAQRLDELEQRLRQAMQRSVRERHQQLAALSRLLHTISPLQTLNRGYAIVRDPVTHTIVRDTRQLQVDDQVEVLLDQGRLYCQVCETQH